MSRRTQSYSGLLGGKRRTVGGEKTTMESKVAHAPGALERKSVIVTDPARSVASSAVILQTALANLSPIARRNRPVVDWRAPWCRRCG